MIRRLVFLAALLLALAVRIAVPAGYMPISADGRVVLAPCPGGTPAPVAMAGMAHHAGEHHDDHAAPQGCAFADLSVPVLDAAAPPLPAALVEPAILRASPQGGALVLADRSRWRPPLRAPPSTRHA